VVKISRIKNWKIGLKARRYIVYLNPNAYPDNVTIHFNEIHNAWFVRNGWEHLWRFQTKKEALKFAINWMREHPNG